VARLGPQDGFAASPSEAELGEAGIDAAHRAGTQTGLLLARMGINLTLAPVVDLDVNPDNPSIGALGRSFSADPDVVVALAEALIEAEHDAGVMTTLKHFPGLGSATGDTDRGIVDISATWTDSELEPFRSLIAADLPDAIMGANAINRQLDAELPASLSPATHDLLRNELGWDGVVITDDLQAGALTADFAADEIIARALAADNDLLLLANQQAYEPDIVARTITTIVDLIASGQVAEARLDRSIARIEAMFRR
jgi:beta-N-acetylhexosaminidase